MTKEKRRRLFRAKVREKNGWPLVTVPRAVGNALGGEAEIPVRVTVDDVPFHAVIRLPRRPPSVFDLDPEQPQDDYVLLIYKEMRDAFPSMRYGMTLEIGLIREEHPRNRRGKRIRDQD